jgi:hypothetical protein
MRYNRSPPVTLMVISEISRNGARYRWVVEKFCLCFIAQALRVKRTKPAKSYRLSESFAVCAVCLGVGGVQRRGVREETTCEAIFQED